ncbi:MAG: hypothetical protein V4507_12500 [Verrucomicrobiota bacterium]
MSLYRKTLILVFLSLAWSPAEEILNYDFVGSSQNHVDALLANPLWKFSQKGELKVIQVKPTRWLQMGGKSDGSPKLDIGFGKAIQAGTFKLVLGTSMTWSNSEVRFMAGDKVLLALQIPSPNRIALLAGDRFIYDRTHLPDLNIAVFGGDIPIRGGEKNRFEFKIQWDLSKKGTEANVQLSQPEIQSETALNATEKTTLLFSEAPDHFEIENRRIDQDSAWVVIYSIQLDSE